MRADLVDRVRRAWNTARFFLRMLIEYVGTVWLLGLAPFLAHLAASTPRGAYEWIPADLWLFVMVLGGNVAIEAFKTVNPTARRVRWPRYWAFASWSSALGRTVFSRVTAFVRTSDCGHTPIASRSRHYAST
jgi:hypothetical protein